jgi:hypothetical protein
MPLASVIGLVVAKRASASGMIVIVSAVLVTLAIDSFPTGHSSKVEELGPPFDVTSVNVSCADTSPIRISS